MMIGLRLVLMATIVMGASCANHVALPKKPLTFLVYMAADNNLADFIYDDLAEMENIGSNEYVNILVYLNTKQPSLGKISRKLVVHKGYSDRWADDKVYDSGLAETVIKAVTWAHNYFPSDRFVIIFWDHGSGSINRTQHEQLRSVCYDDTTGSYLTDAAVRHVLEFTCNNLRGGKIDIVGFDACYMGGIETAYAIKDFAHYMVASEETIPGTGYGYDRILETAARGHVDARLLAYAMVDAFNDEYVDETNNYTISAVELSLLDPLVQKINNVADWFALAVQHKQYGKAMRSLLTDCSKQCQHFSQPTYIDLIDFLNLVVKSISKVGLQAQDAAQVSQALRDTIDAVKRAVLVDIHGAGRPRAHGLSIYYSQRGVDPDYSSLVWAQQTKWAKFLQLLAK